MGTGQAGRTTQTEKALLDRALAALPKAGAVVLSDYAKGALTQNLIRAVLDAANKAGKPVVVDPKGNDFSIYRGATLITPNRKELSDAVRRDVVSDEDVASAAEEVRGAVDCEAVLVTRSDEGMTLVDKGEAPVHVPAYAVKIRDVSGAGDTVVAVLSAMLALKSGFEPAMRAANAAAAVVVGKQRHRHGFRSGNCARASCRPPRLASEEKIVFDWNVMDERLGQWRKQGLRIGFTNGCFDILHPGHVQLLAKARAACDRLVLGLNSDASVTRLKGEGRPVQNVHARAEVLAALEAVDLVVVFEEDTPQKLIERVRPRVLIKGGDYRARSGGRPRNRRGRWRRGDPGRSGAGLFHDRHRRALAPLRQRLKKSRGRAVPAIFPPDDEVRAGARILRRARARLFRRGRRQRSDREFAILPSRAIRLDRHSGRAAARSRGAIAQGTRLESVRGGLFLAGTCRHANAASRARAVLLVRPGACGDRAASPTG